VKHLFIVRSIQIGVVMLAIAVPLTVAVSTALASDEPADKPEAQAASEGVTIVRVIACGGTMALSVLAAAYAVGKVGAAAMGAASEKPELINRALIFVALGEGLAVLGLVVSLLIIILK
jgi:V/A-type H+-transporting ATPase subunit K